MDSRVELLDTGRRSGIRGTWQTLISGPPPPPAFTASNGRHIQRRSIYHRTGTQSRPESVDLVLQGFYLYL